MINKNFLFLFQVNKEYIWYNIFININEYIFYLREDIDFIH